VRKGRVTTSRMSCRPKHGCAPAPGVFLGPVRWAADEFVCGLPGVTLTATARMLSPMTTRVGMAGATTLNAGLAQPGRRVSRRDVLPRTASPA
jgi:hypothetical protein